MPDGINPPAAALREPKQSGLYGTKYVDCSVNGRAIEAPLS